MQAYIKNGEDYYVGKQKANEMCGIDNKSKNLLDHPNDTNCTFITIMKSIIKMTQTRIMNLILTMTWKMLSFHSLYMVTSTPYLIQLKI
jgi:hypothetical protein